MKGVLCQTGKLRGPLPAFYHGEKRGITGAAEPLFTSTAVIPLAVTDKVISTFVKCTYEAIVCQFLKITDYQEKERIMIKLIRRYEVRRDIGQVSHHTTRIFLTDNIF